MTRGRKPMNPQLTELAKPGLTAPPMEPAAGGGDGGGDDPPKRSRRKKLAAGDAPPVWMKDKMARAEWARLLPQMKARRQYIPLFSMELARYCVAAGQFVQAIRALDAAGGPVTKSSKGVPMLSQDWVVMNRAHETMRALAADLGMNPVAQVRIGGLQLDLFDAPSAPTSGPAPSGQGDNVVNAFAAFRRGG